MRIAFLNSIERETYGGMEEWIRLAATGLVRRGHNVSLMGRRGSQFLDRVGRSVPEAEVVALNISGDFNPNTISKIRRYLSRMEIDTLCVNFNKDVRLGGIAARLHGKTRVVWSVGINIARNRFSHRVLTPRLIDRVIVPSHSLKDEITGFGYIDPGCVEVIPIGIKEIPLSRPDPQAYRQLRDRYQLPENAIIAVTVGRFVYKKGHEYLIDAAPAIVDRYPDVFFLFLGDGPMQDLLRRRIAKLGLTDRFVFAGMLENIDLELTGSDLMIHPSKEEPFGIALLEGMRAGLPIVATNVGGIPEVVSDTVTALLCQSRSAEALAGAITTMLSDRGRMAAMGKNGRLRWKQKFSYDTMIDRIESLLAGRLTSAKRENAAAAEYDKTQLHKTARGA